MRTMLTVLGIILAIAVYLISGIYSEAIIKTQSDKYIEFDPHSLYISDNLYSTSVDRLKQSFPDAHVSAFQESPLYRIHTPDEKNNFDVYGVLVGVSLDFERFPIPSLDALDCIKNSTLLYGRSFNNQDFSLNKKVAVINLSMAKLLFGDTNPLGQYVNFDEPSQYMIIGILSDSSDTLRMLERFNNDIAGIEDMTVPFMPFYVPLTSIGYKYPAGKTIVTFKPDVDMFDAYNAVLSLNYSYKNYTYTADSVLTSLEDSVAESNQIINLLVLVMLLMSGMSLSIILIFSFKERLPEIGIKKAIGANDAFILFQFFIENAVLGIVGALFGIVLSFFIIIIATPLILHVPVSSILGVLTWNNVTIPILLSLSVSMAFGYFPSLWAVKQNIMSVLRYE
ncbi:MAG: ABC transporter permease [Christensenellaceae bacterium]|nr:ABC transporter permease [Christensenellaceae bacterium]